MISDEEKELVRQSTDFTALVGETVVLRQKGQDFWGRCPFHHDKNPSFHINPSTGLWKCFGCGKSGDIFAYVMEREHLEFVDALRYLADRAGIELHETHSSTGPRKSRLIEANTEAEKFFSTMLMRGKSAGASEGRSYLAGRGFDAQVCKRWNLGFAPGRNALVNHLSKQGFSRAELLAADLAVERNGRLQDRFYDRVIFPIHDEQGRTIGFGGRVMGDAKPKYLNTAETSAFHKKKQMYAFDKAKESIVAESCAIVVEGYTDVISLHEAGFNNVVATLGTALTADHIKTLSRFAKTIILMFDGDEAGQHAANNAIQFLDRTEASLRCVVLPDNLDPAEFVAERGPAALKDQLSASTALIDFVFEARLGKLDLANHGLKVAALDEMAQLLAPLKTSYMFDSYATRLADTLGFEVSAVKDAIRKAQPLTQLPAREAEPTKSDGAFVPQNDRALQAMTSDERRQLIAERELLSLLASDASLVKPHAERLASLEWADSQDEAMAWAMLATPDNSTPAQMVAAASSVVEEAPRLLAGADRVTSSLEGAEKVSFLLDTVEYHSLRNQIRKIKGSLRSDNFDERATELFKEATRLQQRANELSKRLSESKESS